MSFKSHIPFHRQISGSLISLYLSIIFIIGFTTFLLYQRNVQVNNLVNNQIPALEFSFQYKNQIVINNELVLALNNSQSAKELSDTYEKIKENVASFSELSLINARKINELSTELKAIDETVERIVINDPRNFTLKQTAIVQLGILINTLIEEIDIKSERQLTLHKQVTINGVNGYIPAGNAINYVEVTKVLNQLNKSLTLLDDAIAGFESLNISYSVQQFEDITRKIDLAITTWLSVLTSDVMDMMTRSKIEDLQTLLNVEQRVLGKWYSHLRLSEEVFNRVSIINQKLISLHPAVNRNIDYISADYVIPGFVKQVTEKLEYKLTAKEYYYGLIGLLIFSLLMLLMMLFRLRSKIQTYGENTVDLCANILADESTEKEQSEYVKTAEQLRIVGLIKQIQKPEHSESQFQALQELYQRDLAFINKQHNIVVWHYKPFTQYIDIANFITELPFKADGQSHHWRHLFDRQTLAEVISLAKNVRDSQIVQSYSGKMTNGVQVDIILGFDGRGWLGTLSHHKKFELLKRKVINLNNKHQALEKQTSDEYAAVIEKFGQMVLRAMIQSQGTSIDPNASSLVVYRQLTRMFDWCRQTNIVKQLQNSHKNIQSCDISFEDELHAIVFNAMAEAHLQRNQLFLKTDKQLLPLANIEHVFFHRMLMGAIRVVLAELYNAKMLIELKVVDTDKGKQTVQFSFVVSPASQLNVIPDLVSRLVNEENKTDIAADIITYLKCLMARLNIYQVQSELLDDGFKVMFSMPLVAQNISSSRPEKERPDLHNRTIISLSECQQSQQLISESISEIDGSVYCYNTVESLVEQHGKVVLEKKAIDIIIVNQDIVKNGLNSVKQYINGLPKNLQPKLFVMQPAVNGAYHKEGLYSQASHPLCCYSFQTQLHQLLTYDGVDNLLIDAEILSQHQYLPSRVELLLAVACPEEHQVLIRILQWLGLQVKVVAQPEAMLLHWQSGRYLLLMSEFSHSPLVMPLAGKNIQRGVFTFNQREFDQPTGALLNVIKHWKIASIPHVLDIKALCLLLEPWLKPRAKAENNKPKVLPAKQEESHSYSAFLNETNKLNEADKAYLNNHQLLTDDEESADQDHLTRHVLDMEKFAQNQGSSELAAYMLDEYINDIDMAISAIENATLAHSLDDMSKPIRILLKLSDVMGASDLYSTSKGIAELVDEDSRNQSFTNYDQFLTTLRSHLQSLKEFSDAI